MLIPPLIPPLIVPLIVQEIQKAQNIILSTHKSSDGDGLGSEISMYLALTKLKKNAHFFHADTIPSRYHFLTERIAQKAFCNSLASLPTEKADLVLVFDTHDPKLCSPLFEYATENNIPIYFIDHHVPTDYKTKKSNTLIDEMASCTGEMVFDLIKKLNISLDEQMASALYASLIFDTQNFKLIRDFHRPFQMASELLSHGIDYQQIQQQLFAHWNISKINYLSFVISQVVYKKQNTVAIIKILKHDLEKYGVSVDQVSDFVDLFMQINSLALAVVIREESPHYHKLSFRSRHNADALNYARSFGGGGHSMSAGAWVGKSMEQIEQSLEMLIQNTVD